MDDANWQKIKQIFPEIERIKGTPSLARINGIGTTMLGKRDANVQAGVYVKTQVFSVLFVPVFAVAAYVVADAKRGWYFLGRVPLSKPARLWNKALAAVLAIGVAGLCGWGYLHSPEYQMRQRLGEAELQEQQGHVAAAAHAYADVVASGGSYVGEARTHLESLLARPADADRPELLRLASMLKRQRHAFMSQDLVKRGLDDVAALSAQDPRLALHILDVVAAQPGEGDKHADLHEALLLATVKAHPDDVDAASELAVLHEKRGEIDQAQALLTPLRDKLGSSEGARLLGQILARHGQYEEAYRLLKPYTQERIKLLSQAEAAYNADAKRIWDRSIAELKRGEGPPDLFQRYKAASEGDKQAMVNEYIAGRIAADGTAAAHKAQWLAAAKIVPVALDLGTVTLYRAREMQNPADRQRELNTAKETFLAINSIAGKSDQYRLYLGQTYYWLGQADEGEKLFNELVDSSKRAPATLVTVASALRDVGAMAPARKFAEEAYAKGDTQQKYAAAAMRSLMAKDNDDQIVWLKRSDPQDPSVVASLSSTAATAALRDNHPADALRLYLRSAEAYEKLPESPATLNNAAGEYFAAYAISGDKAHKAKAAEKYAQAVGLDPSNSILLNNTAQTLMVAAAEDAIGGRFDPGKLQQQANVYMLYYVATSQAERAQLSQALLADSSTIDAIRYFDKLAVLRPKSADSYSPLLGIYVFVEDVENLKRLRERAAAAQLDVDDAIAETKAEQRGDHDQKDAQDAAKAVAFLREHLPKLTSPKDRLTHAVAQLSLAEALIRSATYGAKVDTAEVISLASAAYDERATMASYSELASAYLFKGFRTVAASDAKLMEWVKEHQHHLGPQTTVAVGLNESSFKPELLANPDIRKGIEVLAGEWQRFHSPSGVEWKLFSASGSAAASEMAAALRGDISVRQGLDIQRLLNPADAATALEAIWTDEARGDSSAMTALVKQMHGLGVELPGIGG